MDTKFAKNLLDSKFTKNLYERRDKFALILDDLRNMAIGKDPKTEEIIGFMAQIPPLNDTAEARAAIVADLTEYVHALFEIFVDDTFDDHRDD